MHNFSNIVDMKSTTSMIERKRLQTCLTPISAQDHFGKSEIIMGTQF